MAEKLHHVIIGDSAAGITAARYIRKVDKNAVIEVYSDDPNASYYRAALTNYLIGELRDDQIWAAPPTYFSELKIARTLTRVAQVDTRNARLLLSDGRAVSYDRLMIGSGARARPPEFPGADLNGVMVMRTLRDVRQVMDRIKLGGLKQAAIVGGGPLALEWAQGLRERDVKVSIILRGDHFMKNVLDRIGSDLLLAHLKMAGIDVLLNDEVLEALPGKDGELGSVTMKSGKKVNCQLLGVAIGVLPNVEFLEESGVEVGRGGVVVDAQMKTSVEGVFAAGDVAGFQGRALQLWEPAQQQGRVAGYNMVGRPERYEPGAHYMATRLFALDFASVGDVSGANGVDELTDFPKDTGRIALRKVFLKENKLVGALMLGDRSEKVRRQGRAFKRLIDHQVDVGSVRTSLLDPHFNLDNWMETSALLEKPAPMTIVVSKPALMREIPRPQPSAAEVGVGAVPEAQLVEIDAGRSYPLSEMFTLGRASENTLPLNDSKASRRHAEVRWQGTRFFVVDLDSRNGTYVNEARIAEATPLGSGDVLRIGRTRFELRSKAKPPEVQALNTIGMPSPAAAPPPAKTVYASPPALQMAQYGKRWPLETALVRIGRDSELEISLVDAKVSHVHAQITREEEGYYLRDLGSTNGTWVNRLQMAMPHRLTHGDHLRFGETEMTFDSEPAAPPADPAPVPVAEAGTHKPGLLVVSGNHMGVRFEFDKPRLAIGRNPTSDIWIDELSVSWGHAELRKTKAGWEIIDHGSKNGTFVSGERILANEPVLLQHGVEVRVGRTRLGVDLGAQEQAAEELEIAIEVPPDVPESDKTEIVPPLLVPRKAMLSFQSEEGAEQRYALTEHNRVGRSSENDIVLNDKSVSGNHMEIIRQGDQYFVRDLNSSNHTYINGRQIGGELEPLEFGDELAIGSRVKLLFIEEG